jgi:hypothetical protein
MLHQIKGITLSILFFCLLICSCKKFETKSNEIEIIQITKDNLNGLVQKGPFIKGSVVTIYELDSSLKKTGKTYNTIVKSDDGSYDISDLRLQSKFILVSIEGNYYDEVLNKTSESKLKLEAYSDISDVTQLNINILTTLESARILYLVEVQGMRFNEARKIAQNDVMRAIGIKNSLELDSEKISIAGSDQSSAILLAISIMMKGKLEAELQGFIDSFKLDLKDDGKISEATNRQMLATNTLNLDLASIHENITKKFQLLGVTNKIAEFESFIIQSQIYSEVKKTYIPDDKFEAELIKMGLDNVLDDSVFTAKIDTVRILNLNFKGIKTTVGIKDFRNLEILIVSNNYINDIDVSQNIKLRELYINNTLTPTSNFNTISSLDLTRNTELRILDVYDNQIKALDLSKNINLEKLYVGNNHSMNANSINTINLKNNLGLKYLQMGQMNLSNIDLSSNKLIEELILVSMPIKNIDVSGMSGLKKLNIGGTEIMTIDLSKNNSLTHLYALFNNYSYLSSLDLSKNTNLELLFIRSTALKELNLSNNVNLQSLSLHSTNIDISTTGLVNLKGLKNLDIRFQKSGEIDFSIYTKLSSLSLYSTGINSVDVGKNIEMNFLFLENLPINRLDISKLNNLKSFRAANMANLNCIQSSLNQIINFNSNQFNWVKDTNTRVQLECN